jgi:hypothetical protein
MNAAALMAQSGGYLSYIFDRAVAFETTASRGRYRVLGAPIDLGSAHRTPPAEEVPATDPVKSLDPLGARDEIP